MLRSVFGCVPKASSGLGGQAFWRQLNLESVTDSWFRARSKGVSVLPL